MKNPFTFFSLRKSSRILFSSYHVFERKKHHLDIYQQETLKQLLISLEKAITGNQARLAKQLAVDVKYLCNQSFSPSPLKRSVFFIINLAVCLGVALVIRQTLFEFYEIPTGSMRPTFKENDHLVVSKSTFGINIPFQANHVVIDPDLIQRNSTVVFTGEGMDIRDVDTKYFYIFPGKKQYVKRLIGKSGDTLYFYGGKIYGIDSSGNDISSELQTPSLSQIDHIPFIQFDGKVTTTTKSTQSFYPSVILRQMNEPIAKLTASSPYQAKGEMLVKGFTGSYGDLWGIKHFGMSRVIKDSSGYMLEIHHHPSLSQMKIDQDSWGRIRPMLHLSCSKIPLSEDHLHTLFNNLYTARFIVKNQKAYRYGGQLTNFSPELSQVPDGTYEFYYGVAYQVHFGGVTTKLKEDHPLCQFSQEHAALLYNFGIEFDTRFGPLTPYTSLFPSRYVYFRDGSLYAMGSPLMLPSDPTLSSFIETEKLEQFPFIDEGAPLMEDGSLNKPFVSMYGLKIPEGKYLVLGDNHAMSADSRDFGFMPIENLKGSPSFVFWPFNSFGIPNQIAYPFMNLPRSILWSLTALCILTYSLYQRRKNRLPLKFSKPKSSYTVR